MEFDSFRNIQAYILSTELCPKRLQLSVWSCVFAVDVMQIALLSIYFMVISKNYIYFFYFWILVTLLITICSFFVPESPVFYYEIGLWEQARKIVNRMAKMNKSDLVNQVWILDKERLISPPLIISDAKPATISKINESNDVIETLLNKELKPLSKTDIKLHTTGDLSYSATENPLTVMKNDYSVFL